MPAPGAPLSATQVAAAAAEPGSAAAPVGSGTSRPPRAAPPAAPPRESMFQVAQGLLRELPGLVQDRVELLSLELRSAGMALAQIVAMVVAIAVLGVTAWITLWVGVAGALVALGLHWGFAVLAILALNLISAWLAFARIKSLLPKLALPASRRHLSFSPSPLPSDPAEPPEAPHERRPDPVPARPVAP